MDRKSKEPLARPQALRHCRVVRAHSTTAATAGACPPNSVHFGCSHADDQATVCSRGCSVQLQQCAHASRMQGVLITQQPAPPAAHAQHPRPHDGSLDMFLCQRNAAAEQRASKALRADTPPPSSLPPAPPTPCPPVLPGAAVPAPATAPAPPASHWRPAACAAPAAAAAAGAPPLPLIPPVPVAVVLPTPPSVTPPVPVPLIAPVPVATVAAVILPVTVAAAVTVAPVVVPPPVSVPVAAAVAAILAFPHQHLTGGLAGLLGHDHLQGQQQQQQQQRQWVLSSGCSAVGAGMLGTTNVWPVMPQAVYFMHQAGVPVTEAAACIQGENGSDIGG